MQMTPSASWSHRNPSLTRAAGAITVFVIGVSSIGSGPDRPALGLSDDMPHAEESWFSPSFIIYGRSSIRDRQQPSCRPRFQVLVIGIAFSTVR
jgi:hypothetical protein